MSVASLSDLHTQLEIQYMDALTAAYDADDPDLVEDLQRVMKESGMGVADPSSPEGIRAMKQVAEILNESGMDDKGLQDINQQLAKLTQGTEYKKSDPMPPREMSATVDDQAELNQKQPPAPSAGGPIGI